MKTKPVSFVLALVFTLSFAFSACAEREPGDTTAGDAPTDASSLALTAEPSPGTDPVGTTFTLSGEKKEELEEILKQLKNQFKNAWAFWYWSEALEGKVNLNAPKLDLETALTVIEENDDFKSIEEEFRKIQLPDYTYDLGLEYEEFWPKIVWEEGNIYIPEVIKVNISSGYIEYRTYQPGDDHRTPSSSRVLYQVSRQ